MKFSIVIPIYLHSEDQLETALKCLDSVKSFRRDDTEIIVVDSGSTIDTAEMKEVDSYIRMEKSRGIAAAWNTGIKAATGEYIAIINDDIEVYDKWLDHLKMGVEQDNAGAAALVMNQQPNGLQIFESYKWFSGSAFMLKRSTIDEIGLFDEQFYPHSFEDTDYWTRLIKAGKKLYQISLGYTYHREGASVHEQDYGAVGKMNKAKFIDKHGFDPIPYFNGNQNFDENPV